MSIRQRFEGELAEDFSYTPFPDLPPEPPKEEHDHYLACLHCEREFMDECLKMTAEAEERMPEIEKMLGNFRYCGHSRFDLAAMLHNPKVTKEKLAKIIDKSKKIADEKNAKWGQYRIHGLAVGRSVKKD